MADTFETIQNEIEVIRTETGKEKNTQFRVGGVLKKILNFIKSYSDSKPATYISVTDPEGNPNITVKNGDRWVCTGTPITVYERINGTWINFGGGVKVHFETPVQEKNGDFLIKDYQLLSLINNEWVKLKDSYHLYQSFGEVEDEDTFELNFKPIPSSVRLYVNGLLREVQINDKTLTLPYTVIGAVAVYYSAKDVAHMMIYHNGELVTHNEEVIINDIIF